MGSCRMVCAALVMAAASSLQGVTPDQAGSYSGTIKTIAVSASGKTAVKSEMQLTVAVDNTTTITIGGTPQGFLTLFYNATDGFC